MKLIDHIHDISGNLCLDKCLQMLSPKTVPLNKRIDLAMMPIVAAVHYRVHLQQVPRHIIDPRDAGTYLFIAANKTGGFHAFLVQNIHTNDSCILDHIILDPAMISPVETDISEYIEDRNLEVLDIYYCLSHACAVINFEDFSL